MVPKVKFDLGKVEDYLPLLIFFILKDERWQEKIFSIYPALRDRVENSENPSQEIEKFFKKQDKKFFGVMQTVVKQFQDSWNVINDQIMTALAEINEVKLEDFDNFYSRVTLNPICPRFLKTNSFDIYFGLADRTMKTLVLHELSHFFFFKKFKEIYPEVNEDEFESPHLIWRLSEIVPGVIFLNNLKINELFEPQEEALVYESIQKLEVNDKRILDILGEFYRSRISFEDFIRKAYSFLKEHEKEIIF